MAPASTYTGMLSTATGISALTRTWAPNQSPIRTAMDTPTRMPADESRMSIPRETAVSW